LADEIDRPETMRICALQNHCNDNFNSTATTKTITKSNVNKKTTTPTTATPKQQQQQHQRKQQQKQQKHLVVTTPGRRR